MGEIWHEFIEINICHIYKESESFLNVGYKETKHIIKAMWPLLLYTRLLTWQKGVNMDTEFISR